MAKYEFEQAECPCGHPNRVTITAPMHRAAELSRRMKHLGWRRVYTPPATVIVRGGYWDYYAESVAESKKNDRDSGRGWAGAFDG